jgi:hypothetical protein
MITSDGLVFLLTTRGLSALAKAKAGTGTGTGAGANADLTGRRGREGTQKNFGKIPGRIWFGLVWIAIDFVVNYCLFTWTFGWFRRFSLTSMTGGVAGGFLNAERGQKLGAKSQKSSLETMRAFDGGFSCSSGFPGQAAIYNDHDSNKKMAVPGTETSNPVRPFSSVFVRGSRFVSSGRCCPVFLAVAKPRSR